MKKILLKLTIIATVIASFGFFTGGKPSYLYNKLVWSDEFSTNGLPDASKWGYERGNGCPNLCGWGNNELQYYTWDRKENARVENGNLIIQVRKEDMDGSKYTSTRLITKQRASWKYGRIEVRAKLPSGRGIWPAIWMMPENSDYGIWPNSGEIDIMEHVGYMPDSVFSTVHTKSYNWMMGNQVSLGLTFKDLHSAFHLYQAEWSPEWIRFFVDGKQYYEYKNEHKTFAEWPFDKPFFLILNIAVGGGLGGKMGIDDSAFPQKMEVDYVRVYQ